MPSAKLHKAMPTTHVPEHEIEELALGKLRTHDSIRVQVHLFGCEVCLCRLIAITVNLARRGLAPARCLRVASRKPLFIVHDTADGLIYSQTQRKDGKWYAHHWGNQLDGGRECKLMREANQYLTESFAQMFAEHRCTSRCRVISPKGKLTIEPATDSLLGVKLA